MISETIAAFATALSDPATAAERNCERSSFTGSVTRIGATRNSGSG